MSYSFSVVAPSQDEAGKLVDAEFVKVLAYQPSHEHDRQAAQDAAEAMINLLVEPTADECVRVNVSGSLSWRAEGVFTSANVQVNAYIASK